MRNGETIESKKREVLGNMQMKEQVKEEEDRKIAKKCQESWYGGSLRHRRQTDGKKGEETRQR